MAHATATFNGESVACDFDLISPDVIEIPLPPGATYWQQLTWNAQIDVHEPGKLLQMHLPAVQAIQTPTRRYQVRHSQPSGFGLFRLVVELD